MLTTDAAGHVPAAVHTLPDQSSHSGVSWAAVLAGAAVAAALALILLALGSGLGFSSISPWAGAGISATALGVSALVWLFAVQVISSGLGGYLAGRLRTHWVGVHTDEVFFRDTAHGLLAWSVAALVGAAVLTGAAGALVGAAGSVAGTAATAVTGAAATATAATAASLPNGYLTDQLQRSDNPPTPEDAAAVSSEIARIVSLSVARGSVSPEDRNYLAKVISRRTGIDQAQAEQRIDQVIGSGIQAANEAKQKAKEAADVSRKAAAGLSLWIFISLLSGAFSASLFATYGGRLRDRVAGVPTRG